MARGGIGGRRNWASLRAFSGRIARRVSVAAAALVVIVPVVAVAGSGTPAGAAVRALRAAAASPTSAPSAPFIETVTPEGLAALVAWAPNAASDDVTSYSLSAAVTSGYKGSVTTTCAKPAAISAPSTDTGALMGGLCAEVPYTITMTATNAVGTSAASNPSNSVTPLVAQPPSTPLITAVLVRSKSLVVQWSAPGINGGHAVSGYTLKALVGTVVKKTLSASASATQATLTGLINGTAYSLSLTAKNSTGTSVASTSTGTPSASAPPTAPLSFQVVPDGSGNLDATWSAPSDQGSAVVSGYTVTSQQETQNSDGTFSPSGSPTLVTLGASATSDTLSGLTLQSFYSVSLVANSTAGGSPSVSTPSPVTPDVALGPNTVVLSPTTMSALASDTDGLLTWPAALPAQVSALAAGNILVGTPSSAAPDGLLAAVSSVTVNSDGSETVATTTASLSQAFNDLGFSSTTDPLAQPGARFQALAPGVRSLTPTSNATISFDQSLSLGVSAGPISVSGSVDLHPILSASASINTAWGFIPDGVSFSASASINATASLQATLSGSLHKVIGEIPGPPIDIQVGPVPIVLVPKIPVLLDLSGSISFGASASFTVGGSLSWSSNNAGSFTHQNLSHAPTLTANPLPGVAASASGSFGLEIQPQIDIYDLAGPNLEADLALDATVNYNGDPYFEIGPSLSLKIGLDVDVLGFNASLEYTFATLNYPLYELATPADADLVVAPINPSVAPGSSLTFSATRSDGSVKSLTWSLSGQVIGDAITSKGVLTVAQPAGRTLIVKAKDSTGAIGQTQVTVGGEFDPPGNLTASLTTATSATVSWSAPPNTGGAPLTVYTVVTNPPTYTQELANTATGTTITGLSPATTYEVDVYAGNANFETSPPATTTVLEWSDDQSDIYAVNYSGMVTPINPTTGGIGTPVATQCGSCIEGVISPTKEMAFLLTNPWESFSQIGVTEINLATGTGGAQIEGFGEVNSGGLTISPNGQTLYISALLGMTPYKVATGAKGAFISYGGTATFATAISPDGKTLWIDGYIGGGGPDDLVPLNLTTGAVGTPIVLPGSAGGFGGVVLSPSGSTAYVYNSAGVEVVDLLTSTPTAWIPASGSSSIGGFVLTANGQMGYLLQNVANDGGSGITPVNLSTDSTGAFISTASMPNNVGTGLHTLMLSSSGQTAFAAGPNGVIAINVSSGIATLLASSSVTGDVTCLM